MTNLINVSNIKKIVKQHDKRISKEVLERINAKVESIVVQLACVHNGSKKTIDSDCANYIGLAPRRQKS